MLKEAAGLFLAGLVASFAVTASVFAVSAIAESVHYLLASPGFERAANLLLFVLLAGVSGAAAGLAFSMAARILGRLLGEKRSRGIGS